MVAAIGLRASYSDLYFNAAATVPMVYTESVPTDSRSACEPFNLAVLHPGNSHDDSGGPAPPAAVRQSKVRREALQSTKARRFETFIDSLNLKHFSGTEFTPYWSRTRNDVRNSVPLERLWPNIVPTLIILDALRAEFGAPIIMTSTYRSPEYNSAIGGVPRSVHMKFQAVDFQCTAGSPDEWAAKLKSWRGRKFAQPGKQSAFEFRGGVGIYSGFVHVDTRGYNANW